MGQGNIQLGELSINAHFSRSKTVQNMWGKHYVVGSLQLLVWQLFNTHIQAVKNGLIQSVCRTFQDVWMTVINGEETRAETEENVKNVQRMKNMYAG